MSGVDEVLAQFKSELQVSRVSLQTFARLINPHFGALHFCDTQFFQFSLIHLMFRTMGGKKFLVHSNLPLEAFHF